MHGSLYGTKSSSPINTERVSMANHLIVILNGLYTYFNRHQVAALAQFTEIEAGVLVDKKFPSLWEPSSSDKSQPMKSVLPFIFISLGAQ